MRYGVGEYDEMTLEEIGIQYDISKERIRQIEHNAMKKLKIYCEIYKEDFFISSFPDDP